MSSETSLPGTSINRYSLSMVVGLTGISRETLAHYCEQGLLPFNAATLEATEFDDTSLCALRRIQLLQERHGVSIAGIRMINTLLAEVERLRRELEFIREAR